MNKIKVSRMAALSLGVLGCFLSLLLLAACAETITPTPVASPSANRVAVILPGSALDAGWNSLGYNAGVEVESKLGIKVSYSENVIPALELSVLRDYASKGFGLIITHGTQFGESVKRVAAEFPKSWFLVINGEVSGTNYASLRVQSRETAYLAGIAAARVSQGNKFGLVLGPRVLGQIGLAQSFRQGVLSIKPGANVEPIYLGSWEDGPASGDAATQLFDKGAEVILYTTNAPTQPVLKIAQERKKLVINENFDISSIAPDTVLTSLVFSMPTVYMTGVNWWREQKLTGKIYDLGLKEQAVGLAPFRGKLSAADEALIEQAKADIINGKVDFTIQPTPTPGA